eukprot:477716-Rhodomonas_salina.1
MSERRKEAMCQADKYYCGVTCQYQTAESRAAGAVVPVRECSTGKEPVLERGTNDQGHVQAGKYYKELAKDLREAQAERLLCPLFAVQQRLGRYLSELYSLSLTV